MTVEERLAALEKAMATMQEENAPTEYYTSKYSGEEIDALLDIVANQMSG